MARCWRGMPDSPQPKKPAELQRCIGSSCLADLAVLLVLLWRGTLIVPLSYSHNSSPSFAGQDQI